MYNAKYNDKQAFSTGETVWINDMKLIEELRKQIGKKFNFFGKILGYLMAKDSYKVEFKTEDNQFETFVIESDKLSTPKDYSKKSIKYILENYDSDSLMDYLDMTKGGRSYYRRNHEEKNDTILSVNKDDINLNKRKY